MLAYFIFPWRPARLFRFLALGIVNVESAWRHRWPQLHFPGTSHVGDAIQFCPRPILGLRLWTRFLCAVACSSLVPTDFIYLHLWYSAHNDSRVKGMASDRRCRFSSHGAPLSTCSCESIASYVVQDALQEESNADTSHDLALPKNQQTWTPARYRQMYPSDHGQMVNHRILRIEKTMHCIHRSLPPW